MVIGRTQETVRQRLLEAATRLFAARGFDATPIQAVADEVGVTKAALLHHFESKEQLRQEVVASILAHWNDRLPRLLLAATASDDRFDTVFGELYRFFSEKPDLARFVLREALDRPVEARRLLRGVLPVIDAIAAYVKSGQTSGRHFSSVDAEAYLFHALNFIVGSVAIADVVAPALGHGEEGKRRFARELVRIAKTSLFLERPESTKPTAARAKSKQRRA